MDKYMEKLQKAMNNEGVVKLEPCGEVERTENDKRLQDIFDLGFQNGLEVLDLGQNQDIIRTKRALAQQASLGGSPSVDDQLYSVSCVTGIDVKVIMNTWTINRFNEMLKACDRIIHYKIYRSAEMSGMVTFKNGIPVKSWLKSEDNSEGKMKTITEASNTFGGVVK